ncbi:ABC transporter ATP-binding protein [Nocardia stercoris]|uniref:ABC-type quaternary amine transporter n=1 Tax=Nocardia stercoris TaxID=2483361 RepID=A0A3M2LJG7_9NOCA|nr:ABC transporter ATP-binding protein [Nocardia stercoris]RMI34918.1 ABC transporter ATP-binding protein [Nocardia stercoris]
MTSVSITNLTAGHGHTPVLHDVDLAVEDGSLACVLGPSGCGKSTLMRVIAGFHPATGGTVAVGGRVLDDDRTHVRAEQRRIGFVPQQGALFPHLSAAANIGFGVPRAQRRERVAEMLELVGLSGLGSRHPHELSGGQQQRVALARALAPAPELLLLDEPFSALDAALRTDLRTEVADLLRRAKATAILVTHDVEEALAVADRIAVLRAGRIVQTGTPQELFRFPVDGEVARTLGEANLIPVDATTRAALALTGTVPDAAVVVVRPHQLRLDTGAGVTALPYRVRHSQFRGHDYRVELTPEPGSGLPPTLIAYTCADAVPPATGAAVHVTVCGPTHLVSA